MGPQSFHCGNYAANMTRRLEAMLLQWGRSLSTAETRPLREVRKRIPLASMGPQSFNCGNAEREGAEFVVMVLQWGRSLSTAETARPIDQAERGPSASMGPQSFKCGNSDLPSSSPTRG